MAYAATVKDGSGDQYWLLVNDDGQLIIAPAWVPGIDIDVAADDSDKAVAVTALKEWILDSVWIELTTTSTANVRQIVVEIQDGSANVIARFVAGATQDVSITRNYLFAPGIATSAAFIDTDHLTTPIPELHLPAGYVIRVYDNNAVDAAADDMEVTIRYRERTA